MSEFNFEQLKDINFNIPESWIENVLDVPPKKKKPAAAIVFYRYAIGAAACLVLAMAVTFSLLFGFGKNVKLTNPDNDDPYLVEQTTDESSATDSTGGGKPSDILPRLFGGDEYYDEIVTEPAETDGSGNTAGNRRSASGQQAATPSNGSKKPSSQNSSKQSGGNQTDATDPAGNEPETDAPDTQKPWVTPPTEDPWDDPWEEPWFNPPTDVPEEPITVEPWIVETTEEPGQSIRTISFSMYAMLTSENDTVYCRITGSNGSVIKDAPASVTYNSGGYSYVSCSITKMVSNGDCFTVCFYRRGGGVFTTKNVTIDSRYNYGLGYFKNAAY